MKRDSFIAIARALNDAEVPFIVVGGLAVNAHGYGRVTFDVDLVIRLLPEVIQRAFVALDRIDYHPAVPITAAQFGDQAIREGFHTQKGMLVLKFWSDTHRETPLDVFITEPFAFEQEYAAAELHEAAPGVILRIVRYETLVRLKREAGRHQDLADIAELEFIKGNESGPRSA